MIYCFPTNYSDFKVIPLIISFHSYAVRYTSWSGKETRRAKTSSLAIDLEAHFINTMFSEGGLLVRYMFCLRMCIMTEKLKQK